MKIRSVTTTIVSLVAIGLFASGSDAKGLTSDQLIEAGYSCFNAGPSNYSVKTSTPVNPVPKTELILGTF